MLAAASEVMLGKISTKMIRNVLSPLTSAAETKSFSRSESVCERRTRAPHAQLVTVRTAMKPRAAAAEEANQHHQQRHGGNDQEDIGDQGKQIVDLAAKVAGGHAYQGREHRGQDANHDTDPKGLAGSPNCLIEHILTCSGGTEPVLAGWGEVAARDNVVRIARRDDWSEDRDGKE